MKDQRGPDLFDRAAATNLDGAPLAARLRPQSLDEVVGQQQILGPHQALRKLIERGETPSMILWGPPGCGKTTLAAVIACTTKAEFESVSAVMSGVKELREVVARAADRRKYHRRKTVLFIDEIHRFNRAQQDALLPHVERGVITLIGATTENPSFEVNAALLSRMRVFVLEPLTADDLQGLLERALTDPKLGLGDRNQAAGQGALSAIAKHSQGDARRALTTLEVASDLALSSSDGEITLETVAQATQHKALLYDKSGDEHYNIISAFIKSLRGSDPDAATYWMVRMLESGETPRFILRRMVIFASEDIGNADPQALQVAVNALSAFELVGLPEGVLPMTQAATYLACAPKSNAVIVAYKDARADVREHGPLQVPSKLRNAPTNLMKNLGYGKDYKYPHNFSGNYVAERYLPDELQGARYYQPSAQGAEREIGERLARLREASPPENCEP